MVVEHSLKLPLFGIAMKMTLPFFFFFKENDLSSPVATAEFSKFASILSAAL